VRELTDTAPTCDALADALAVTIALTLDEAAEPLLARPVVAPPPAITSAPPAPRAAGDLSAGAILVTGVLPGTDLSNTGGCKTPPGTFACGYLFCSLSSQVCIEQLSTVGPFQPACDDQLGMSVACSKLEAPDCSCMPKEIGGHTVSCAGDPATGLVLTVSAN
jgi:hypothetical protein